MSSAEKLAPRYTVTDYQHWEGDWELWGGRAVSMSPSPFGRHGKICGRITSALVGSVDEAHGKAHVLPETDWNVFNETVLRPDVSVVYGAVPEKHIHQTPEIVVEVLSKTTRQRDVGAKLKIYQEEKVPWYLILDPESERLTVMKIVNGKTYEEVASSNPLLITICGDCNLRVMTGKLFIGIESGLDLGIGQLSKPDRER